MAGEVSRQDGTRSRPSWQYRTGPKGERWVDYETHSLEMLESCRNVMESVLGELQRLNGLLHCNNFVNIPKTLRAINRNTTKRKYVRKVKA